VRDAVPQGELGRALWPERESARVYMNHRGGDDGEETEDRKRERELRYSLARVGAAGRGWPGGCNHWEDH
jgi:hypothetical protein